MSKFINYCAKNYFLSRKIHLQIIRKESVKYQHHWFRYLSSKGINTVFGNDFGIHKNLSYYDFTQNIPLQDYNSLLPYIENIEKGGQQILTQNSIKWLAKSSGTSDTKSKFIPVSKETLSINNYVSAKDVLTTYCSLFPDTQLFSGRGLLLGGSFQPRPLPSSLPIGDISAILLNYMPALTDLLRASTRKILLCDDWNKKLKLLAQSTYNQNITSLSGVPSWLFMVLKEVLNITHKTYIKEVWQHLELFMHGGVSFAPYKEEYNKLIGHEHTFFMNTYNASEGFFGFQDQKEEEDLLLLTDNAVFYEFIPVNKVGDLNTKAIPLEEVKTRQNYAIIITTASGLWRYVIGDTLMFTSVNPYRFRITGRTTHYINAFGEEVIIDNAEKALSKACEATGSTFADYTAAPHFAEESNPNNCHEWLIEFITAPKDISLFINALDSSLKQLNSDYEAKRTDNLLLSSPIVHQAKQGLFLSWLKTKNKLGGQYKVPRLQNDRKILNELLIMNKKNITFVP
ncbi:MAG: GH3 auxin-responsive promoter family protein [Bacteroidales bacterium]|jgi:hypothetical protein|nr:GH3 auxin-responsive promoter family protein [Bacteroidales bacterium]